MSRLLRNRSFWYLAAFLVIIGVIGTYMLEPYLLGDEPDKNVWHPIFVATRNFMLLGIIFIAAWEYGFIAGLVALLVIGLISLPHVIEETIIEGHHPSVLTEYAIIIPVGVALAWLISSLKQAEGKLKDSEKRYRRLFETAQDAILILDGNSGKIIDANPVVRDLLEYTREELVGKNLWEIGEIKDTLAGRISYQELFESGYKRWDNLPLVTRHGQKISVEVVANAYQVDHKRVIQCNIRDMTVAVLATEALKALNEDLKVAQRLTKIGNWKWIIATNEVTWSDELYRINGWDVKVPVPPFAEMERFYTPEGWKRLNEVVTNALKIGEPYELELTRIRTDGTRIITFLRGEADFDADGKIVSLHGTVQDITRQKQAEATMNFQSQILQNMSEGVVVTRVVDQIIVSANPPFERMFGYGPGELLGKHVSVLNASTDEQSAQAKAEEIIKGLQENGVWHGDVHNIRKDGSIFWCRAEVSTFEHDIYGRVWIAVHQDITEHRASEEELLRLRQAVETSGEAVFLTDREGVITYINPEFTQLYGYTAAEVIGKTTPRILKGGRTRPEEYAAFWNELICKRVVKGELVNKTKDGRLITVEGSASPILNSQGNIIGFLAIQRDITERIKLQQQIMAQDRLASIGQLVSGAAHEINNPLTGVIGFSELLLKREDLPADVKEDLKVINGEATRTSRIVNNLLTFARSQPEGKAPVKIYRQIQAVLVLRAHEQKVNNIQVITHFASDLPPVMGNASQLQQVFFNIIINAEFFMFEAHQKGNLTITTERRGDFVRASFSDDGPGISPENMSKLFTPFFTTKEVGKGTGLGLSICHGIVTEHGGRIYAESEPEKGATFVVELPIKKTITSRKVAK